MRVFCNNFCSVCVCVHLCSLSKCILSHVSLVYSLLLQLYGFVSFYTQLRLILFTGHRLLRFNKLLIIIEIPLNLKINYSDRDHDYDRDLGRGRGRAGDRDRHGHGHSHGICILATHPEGI